MKFTAKTNTRARTVLRVGRGLGTVAELEADLVFLDGDDVPEGLPRLAVAVALVPELELVAGHQPLMKDPRWSDESSRKNGAELQDSGLMGNCGSFTMSASEYGKEKKAMRFLFSPMSHCRTVT